MGHLLLMGALLAQAARGDAGLAGMEMLLQTGRARVVIQQASAALEADPDSPEWHALLGIAWSRSGYFADALGAFALSGGSVAYEDLGIEAHAAALRACVGGEAAARLRQERLLSPLSENIEHRIWMNAADDLREVGELDAAEALALQGYAAFPTSSVMLSLLADLALDRGALDEADFYLWRGVQGGGGGARLDAVLIRRALVDGDVQEALARSQPLRVQTANPRLAALRAEALRQSGDPVAALEVLERTRWRLTEEPELLAVRLQVLLDLGEDAEARALGARLAELSGHLVVVQAALDRLRSALPQGGVQ